MIFNKENYPEACEYLGIGLKPTEETPLDSDIETIMGSCIDAAKFRSSMTLFYLASPDDIFKKALDTFFDGKVDERTVQLLGENVLPRQK